MQLERRLPFGPGQSLCTDDRISDIENLDKLRRDFYIPDNVELLVADSSWRAGSPPVGWRCVYVDQLSGGLRFPIHPFFCSVLNHYGMPLAQIVPNAMRILVHFVIACAEVSVEPNVPLFRYFFQFRRAAAATGYYSLRARADFRIDTPDNNRGWKSRFVFFRTPGLDIPENWNFGLGIDSYTNRKGNVPRFVAKFVDLPPKDAREDIEEDVLVNFKLSPAVLSPRGRRHYDVNRQVVQPGAVFGRMRSQARSDSAATSSKDIATPSGASASKSQKRKAPSEPTSRKSRSRPSKIEVEPLVHSSSSRRVSQAVITSVELNPEGPGILTFCSGEGPIPPVLGKSWDVIRSDALQVCRVVDAMVAEVDAVNFRMSEQNKVLATKSKELFDSQQEVAVLKAEIEKLHSREVNQGELGKQIVKGLMKSTEFGTMCIELAKGAVSVGRHQVLEELMEECPQLKLKKKRLGWDPYCEDRVSSCQQDILKNPPEFSFLEDLTRYKKPLSLEQIGNLDIDYDVDLDKNWGEIPKDYECEDDDLPLFMAED